MCFQEFLAAADHAAQGAALAVDIFGRGMDHDVAAELDRPLHRRAGKSIVHQNQGAGLIGNLGHRAEIDDLTPHAAGGPSRPSNTDCKCGYCHDLKDAGWRVERDAFDQTHWTSPLGHRYTVPPEPVSTPQQLTPLEHHLVKITRMRR